MTVATQLCQTSTKSDLLINFNGTDYHAHFIILGMKCHYFASLYFSGCQESAQGRITITLEDISQPAFTYFLQYVYGALFKYAHMKDLIKLADYFQCEELAKECANFPLYKLGSAVEHATWIIEDVIPSFTLLEKDTFIEDVKLKEAFLWFVLHFDEIVRLELELLSSIPINWLRFVFGRAPCHCFDSEKDRLDKAIAFYFRMGHSDELFSALFENIRYACIPPTGLSHRRYLFLYRTSNEKVRRQMMLPRGTALPLELQKTNFGSLMLRSEDCQRHKYTSSQLLFGENFGVVLKSQDKQFQIQITSFLSQRHFCDITGHYLVIKDKGQFVHWEPLFYSSQELNCKLDITLPSLPSYLTEKHQYNVKLIVSFSDFNVY
jgi:hypothetical protein